MSDENATTALPKADRITMTAATTGEDTLVLHFPERPDGAVVGQIIGEVSAALPGTYFHYTSSDRGRSGAALTNHMVALTPEGPVTVEDLEALIRMFRPDTYLIGLAQVQAGQRSFEVTMNVLNYGEDTPAETYRELISKLQTIPGVTEVMWDGEQEIFMIVSGNPKLVYRKWTEDTANIAGISIRPTWSHSSPIGALVSALIGECGHTHH